MNAADLARYLVEMQLAGEVVWLPEPTPTVEAAARAAGTAPERIAKSILFLADGAPVLVVASGLARVDHRRLAGHLNLNRKKLRLADAPTVLAVTGYPVGSVPPLGHPAPLRTVVDVSVLAQPEVFAGGGAVDALLRIAPAEIVRATGAQTADVRAAETEAP